VNVLLAGIVGSQAYGLETEASDVDTLGLYACDTRELHGLKDAVETTVLTNPDSTYHEARKYARLALRCNPTVLELMWLPEYIERTTLGRELIGIRKHFLSQRLVRDSYLGYATQQFRRLEQRGNGTFSADTAKRTAKHARHLRRLIYQGTKLWDSGCLEIKVYNPEAYHEFGERVAAGDLDLARGELAWAEKFFDDATPGIPIEPNTVVVERWLQRVRREYWKRD
jgi:predicted nucleotidyltransferase